jgi:hypothetical protein
MTPAAHMFFGAIGSSSWSPADLSGLAPSLSVAEQRSSGLLFQDTGKTTSATADTDPARVATPLWTGADYVAPSDAARPLLRISGATNYLALDGVDDQIESSIPSAFTDGIICFRGRCGTTTAGFNGPVWMGGTTGDRFGIYQFNTNYAVLAVSGATTVEPSVSTTATNGSWATVTGLLIGGTGARLRVNGTQIGSANAAIGTITPSVALRVGRRGNNGGFWLGDMAGAIIVLRNGSAITSDEITLIEAYVTGLAS